MPDGNFAITAGGPFYRVLSRFHLRAPSSDLRCWLIAVIVWLPIGIGAGIQLIAGIPRDPILNDLSLHVRVLFALPVLLLAESLFDQTTTSAMTSMYGGNFCDRGRLDDIIEHAERMRDSWQVELLLVVTAIVGGQLTLWNVFGPAGVFHGVSTTDVLSFPRVWYAVIALPIVQFVMFRWMWHWLIWAYVIARISRLPLVLLATHADYAAGLSALARPVTAFSRMVLAISALLAAAWGTRVMHHETTLPELLPMLATFLLTACLVAVGPLLLLTAQLSRARRRSLAQYGDFMRAFVLQFHDKWILQQPRAMPVLGVPDMSTLHDLGESYLTIAKTRVFAFGSRTVLTVWFAGLIPMVPLFATAISVDQILKRIVGTVLGGLPL